MYYPHLLCSWVTHSGISIPRACTYWRSLQFLLPPCPPSFLKYLSHCSNHTPSQNMLQGVRFICSQLNGCSHYGIVESWWDPQPESRNKCMLLVLRLLLSFFKSSFSPYIWDVAGHCSLFSVTPRWRHPHRHIQRRAGFLYELFLNPVSRMSKSPITFFILWC